MSVMASIFTVVASGVMWWIGDLLNYGEKSYGETYTQAMDATDLDYGTVRNAKYVSGRIEKSLRSDNLTFTHHSVVAPLPPPKQKTWLAKAEKDGLTEFAFDGT